MKRTVTTASATLAIVGLMASGPVLAQPRDLDPTQVSAATRYALPLAFDGYVARCSGELDPAGYSLSNAARLRVKFAEDQDEAWPAAKQTLIALASEGDGADMAGIFDLMGDAELRPFVDALVGSMLSQEIKLKDCGDIDRGLEILDPLPAENLADLVGFLFEMGHRGDEDAEVAAE